MRGGWGIRALAGFDGGNDRCPFSPPIPGKVIFRRMGKTTLGGLKKGERRPAPALSPNRGQVGMLAFAVFPDGGSGFRP